MSEDEILDLIPEKNKKAWEELYEIVDDVYIQGATEGSEYSCGIKDEYMKSLLEFFQKRCI